MATNPVQAGLNSPRIRTLSIVSIIVDAALAIKRGNKKVGMLLLGAAALGSKSTIAATAIQLLVRLVRWRR